MDHQVEWLTRPAPEDKVPSIDFLIAVFRGNKKDDGNLYPSIKSWTQLVIALNDLLKNRCNLKGELVLCPYLWPNGQKEFSSGIKHK